MSPQYRVIFHAMLVLGLGLIAGVMLVFSLLDAINLWPLPVIEVAIPGSTRGWQAAHVGGIMNGIMLTVFALTMVKLDLVDAQTRRVSWALIGTGWGNTVFYWAGNFAPNRALSAVDTSYGQSDIFGILGFFGGGIAMIFTFYIVFVFAMAALKKSNSTAG